MPHHFPTQPDVSLPELAVYSALTVCIWVLSITVLFPIFLILKLSSWIRNKFFCYMMKIFGPLFKPAMTQLRTRLFEIIEDHYKIRGNSKIVRVLEIGVGTGPNFAYYPENFSVSLLDSNPNFLDHVKGVLKSYPKLNVDKIVLGKAEQMTGIRDGEYDLVLCTHLLCSVQSVEAVLKEVRRVLKKGGKFAFLEHTRYPDNHLAYRIQRCNSPLWKVYNDGCVLHRYPQKTIKESFISVNFEIVYPPSLSLFFRPHIIGVATK